MPISKLHDVRGALDFESLTNDDDLVLIELMHDDEVGQWSVFMPIRRH